MVIGELLGAIGAITVGVLLGLLAPVNQPEEARVPVPVPIEDEPQPKRK